MKKEYDMFFVTYGSKLYGTNTPTSDTDNKVVYLPALTDMLLGKKLQIYKERFDAEGNCIGDGFTMPDNGTETEYFPVQTFVRDFVNGQTYAQEIAFALYNQGPPPHGITYTYEIDQWFFIKELVEKFKNAEVYSMVGFAMKQTFDYVRRGERLNAAKVVLEVADDVHALVAHGGQEARLDWEINGETVLEHIAKKAGLETEVLTNGKKPQNSLKLNGRNYLESTTIQHFKDQVKKIIHGFGDRSTAAADTEVDYKSLSHAVRVYQQAIELLDTGNMTFPRPNAAFLLSVKQGKEDLEQVKRLLMALDDEVKEKIEASPLQRKTPQLLAEAEEWMVEKLHDLYSIAFLQEEHDYRNGAAA